MSECEFIDKLSHDGWNCPNCRDEYRARKMAEWKAERDRKKPEYRDTAIHFYNRDIPINDS